jgi:large exoprotein involved in heme utilization and adhesion
MNHTYRLLWSHARRAWVVVGETARSQSKNTTRGIVIAATSLTVTAMLATPTQAGPSGGQVTAGQGGISHSADTTTINQSSNNLSVNWQSFNVNANETVNFIQPSATAIAINHI